MTRLNLQPIAAAIAALLTVVPVAHAQQLNPGISCITGNVPGYDYAELTSSYRESIWDTKAAMRLTSTGTQLELFVTDELGHTVCEDTADMKVRCKFSFSTSYSGTFNIKIDNTQFSADTGYTLCAE